ncbi:MAG: amino acid ABC transporter substrate-binding protein [Deltaproteobacteria bacterium]|nr:amino acid ABC transporter substrate-binding protein [Deltaproteobacteria bacterium]
MKKKRSIGKSLLIAVLLLSAVLFTYTASFAQPAPQSIRIGTVVPLTGRMASGGKDLKAGYEIAVKHINTNGGVMVKELGKKLPIELIVLDDESDPVKTTARLDKLYSVDKVVAYMGGYSSLLNVAGLSAGEKNKVPWIGVTIAVEGPFKRGFKYIFAPFSMSSDQVKAFFDLLDSIPKNERPTKIAYFEEQSDWGLESGKYLRELAKAKGYAVVVDQKFASAANDFSSLVLAAKAAGADALYSVPTPPQSMVLVRQMKQLDYAPKVTTLIRGPDLTTYWDALGADANYILSDGNWQENMPYPNNKKLVQDYHAAFPQEKNIGLPVGAAYAAVQILADSIERAGSLDREKLRAAIGATNMVTVRGPVKFRSNGTGIVKYGLRQWQNGKNELVSPPDVATAKFLMASPWNKR